MCSRPITHFAADGNSCSIWMCTTKAHTHTKNWFEKWPKHTISKPEARSLTDFHLAEWMLAVQSATVTLIRIICAWFAQQEQQKHSFLKFEFKTKTETDSMELWTCDAQYSLGDRTYWCLYTRELAPTAQRTGKRTDSSPEWFTILSRPNALHWPMTNQNCHISSSTNWSFHQFTCSSDSNSQDSFRCVCVFAFCARFCS